MSRKKSRKSCRNNARKPQYVVIKGLMSTPTMLIFVNKGRKSVTVLCRDGETQMDFANDVVFQYNPESFGGLCEAFRSGDNTRLEKEWRKAKPIIST